jgi:site-specific recombinase XerD
MNQKIRMIEQALQPHLNNLQMEKLHQALIRVIEEDCPSEDDDRDFLPIYLAAKRVEGCSDKTLHYYETSISNALVSVNKPVKQITTDDLRLYLDTYQQRNNAGKVTIDNVRRVLSSFFSWLEDEDYILKSPVRRIHKVKTGKTVKETYSDEALEIMRDHAENIRDLAMIDLLASTGMRVGELVQLNRGDIDFENRECIVFGKGDKERKVYFDARAKIHLQNYLTERSDDNPALFVTLLSPFNRLKISGVEIRLRELGRKLNIPKVHPHKFRRTLATMAIDKGMPIEQVQHLLGHQSIDTTMVYAQVSQSNVKTSHRKYIS